MASTGVTSRSKFSLKIESEVIKCLDTGSSIAPDASVFKSFACCKKGGENAGDESDFLLFVVTASATSDDKASNEGGIDMVWVDSESSSGYSKKSLMGYDSRLANQRPVHVEATQGADGQPILVGIFASATPTVAESKRFTVWICSELSTSNDGDDTGKPNWKPCGWFDGAEVKRASATTSPTGDHLVVVEGLDSNGEARVYYGDTSDAKTMEMQLVTFPKPRDMNSAIQQVAFVRDSAFETATSLVLGTGADNGSSAVFVQSLPDTNVYQGTIDIPEDTRCFATSEGSRGVDLYVAGAKTAWCYELNAWSSSDSPRNRHQINEVDFESPAMNINALVDTEGTKHIWILLENGDLMYTFDALGDDQVFLEPVNILPSTSAFGCHIDPVGNIHVLGVSDDGKMVHNMKDEGTGLWMQKEILVPGGRAEEHLMSVVEVNVKALGSTAKELIAAQSLPSVLISSASAAFFRVNGKGHMMYSDKVIEVTPSATGVVRVMQFVDSFIVPRVMINVAGLERPLEVHCSKAVQNKLRNTSGDELRSAKLPDAMGKDGASLITDPDVEQEADDVADTLKGLLETFDTFQSSDFVKKNDVSGDFRLGGGALSDENQFVTWGNAEDDALNAEDVGIPFTGDFPILIDGTQDNITGPTFTPFTGTTPILVAANVAGEGTTSRSLPSCEKLVVRKKAKSAKRTTGRVARRFSKMRVVSDEAAGGKENTTKHFSFKRAGKASATRPGEGKPEAIKSEKIKIKHQDAGDIAKITKEAGNKANLQAKYAAAENVRLATEFAEKACERAWADADDAAKAAAEAVALAKQAIEEEEGIAAGDSVTAEDETGVPDDSGEDKSRALSFQPRGIGGAFKKAARKAREAAERAAKEADKAAKKAADAAKAAAQEALKAAEKAKEEAARAAQEAAERAREAAEKAAEAAAQAAEAVADLGEDVGEEIGDTVDDAKDTLGDITDIINDAVEDAANVVESVTMEVVDVIEEVIEVVEEVGPDGVIRLVTKVVKTVVKTAIRVIVEVAGKVFEFIADQIEKAQAALNWVWEKIKVGIYAALRWLASFFNIFEIIKTAEILEDTTVDSLGALVEALPTEEDMSRVFNSIRESVEKLTGLDLDSAAISDESEGPDEDLKGSYVSYHALSGSFNDAIGDLPQDSIVGDAIDQGLGIDAGIAAGNLETMQSLISKLTEGGSLQDVVSAMADGFLDNIEADAKGVLNGATKAVDLLKEWLAGGDAIYIPVISEMFKLATGKNIPLGKAIFFMIAIPTTYGVKLATGKFPSQVMRRTTTSTRAAALGTAPSRTASLQLDQGVSLEKSFASTARDGETEEDAEEEKDANDKDNELALKIAAVACDTMALGLTVATFGKVEKFPFLAGMQMVFVIATEGFRMRGILLNNIGQSRAIDTLSTFRYCFSLTVAIVQVFFRLPAKNEGADDVDPWLKAANSTMNIFVGIVKFTEDADKPKKRRKKAFQGIQFILAGVAGVGVVMSTKYKSAKGLIGFGSLKMFTNGMGIGLAKIYTEPDEYGMGV